MLVVCTAGAEQYAGYSISNATFAAIDLDLRFTEAQWQEDGTMQVSGTIMNPGIAEAQFVRVELKLLDAAGRTLVEKDVPVTPQTILPRAYGSFDVWLDVAEKPSVIVYELSTQ
jgi:hypothetical protein